MTNDLATWLSRLCLTFDNAALAPYNPDRRSWLDNVLHRSRAEQQAILRAYREQSAVIVLLLRNEIHDERAMQSNDGTYDAPGGDTSEGMNAR